MHAFVIICGTTLPDTPTRKRQYDAEGKAFYKEVQRTTVTEEYYDVSY